MLDIIDYYHFFIAAKIHRGFYSFADFEEDEEDATRSDADGSIKIALIAIDRSIIAWSVLTINKNYSKIRPILLLLEKIRRECEEKFSTARDLSVRALMNWK
jgi:hypothetical protein